MVSLGDTFCGCGCGHGCGDLFALTLEGSQPSNVQWFPPIITFFCGCGHDLFALKSTLSVGMGVTIGCCLLVLALDICVGIGCVIVGCVSWV